MGEEQVDSRPAAVNTNNGEYRLVNCVPLVVRAGLPVCLPSRTLPLLFLPFSTPGSSLFLRSSRLCGTVRRGSYVPIRSKRTRVSTTLFSTMKRALRCRSMNEGTGLFPAER